MSSVTVLRDDFTPWVNRTKAELNKLSRLQVNVGILGSAGGELLKIAYVQEFGFTITPKTAKNLAIPLKPKCKGKSPRDFPDTFVLDNGENRFIAQEKGKDKVELLFLLVPSVTIPERSFIRAGYDNNKDKLAAAIENAMIKIINGEWDAMTAANNIGATAVGMIKKYMRTVGPPKSSVTLASAPGKTTPLVQSGRLRDSITYEVVSA